LLDPKVFSVTSDKLVLVTGVTGYVGGCLVPLLLEKGYRVRVLVRDPARLSGRVWVSLVEVLVGDTLSVDILTRAMQGISTAYYLVHNMSSGRNYVEKEIDSARNFASSAAASGVEHIIYLGGLADPDAEIGLHLRSRLDTGAMLRRGIVPVTEFRASLIIGSGSISFEMIRYLTEQFPILFAPPWKNNHTQPISIQNVLEYLLSALENTTCRGKIYEIGGKDILTYADTLFIYARLRGLKRYIIALPWMPVKLMAQFAGILTPVPARIASPLLGGMRTDSLVRNDAAQRDFPRIQPMNYEASVSLALENLSPGCLESVWKKSDSSFRIKQEGFFVEGQQIRFHAQPDAVFCIITGLGGKRGWLYGNLLWKLRGILDKLVGGPGLRGLQETGALSEGDVLDFYRVELLEPGKRMLLKAELKTPGLGWMEWRILEQAEGDVVLTQIAYFAPRGLPGFLYWYILLPIHRLVFNGLIKAIVHLASES
jgi:uncharacterized protein YbjT (DUF2867 family)